MKSDPFNVLLSQSVSVTETEILHIYIWVCRKSSNKRRLFSVSSPVSKKEQNTMASDRENGFLDKYVELSHRAFGLTKPVTDVSDLSSYILCILWKLFIMQLFGRVKNKNRC